MPRNCYCDLWMTNPRQLEQQGIPPGYCGICERCGKPGHTQHFPGPVPYTGAWCDHCVQIVRWTHLGVWLQFLLPAAMIALIIWSVWKVFRP